MTLAVSHKLLPCECVCVSACGYTWLNNRFDDEMQLPWPTSSLGFFLLQNVSSLPPASSCVPFQSTAGGMLLWPHCRHTSHWMRVFAPVLWLFYLSFGKAVCKGILRISRASLYESPLIGMRNRCCRNLRPWGGSERSQPARLTNCSIMCGLLSMCFWCIRGLHTGSVDMNRQRQRQVQVCPNVLMSYFFGMSLNEEK